MQDQGIALNPLAQFSDEALQAIYGRSADEATHRALEAEMERRWAAAESKRQDAERRASDPRVAERAEWRDAAHAQFLAAEAECNGYLVRGPHHDFQTDAAKPGKCAECGNATDYPRHRGVDAFALWSGSEGFAHFHATDELRAFWDSNPRLTVTEYQRQAAAGRAEAREAYRNDRMDTHARGTVRQVASAEQGREGDSRDRRADTVPGPDARALAAHVRQAAGAAARAGGPVRAGTGMTAADQVEALNAMAASIRARAGLRAPETAPAVSGTLSPAPDAGSTAGSAVAVREGVIVARPQPVDGDMVARYIYTALKRFAIWNSEAEIITATAWIMQAHAKDPDTGQPVWQYSPRLFFAGPSGSGKSWKARLVCKLSPSGEILLEPTKPSFLDMCADNQTIAITEADELFYTAGRNRGILAAVNAGYEPDRHASRKHGGKTLKIPVFTPVVLDGLATMLAATRSDLRTMVSRCLVVICTQAPEGYRPPRFDGQARSKFEELSQRAAGWAAQEVAAGMGDTVPVVPGHLGNRPFALWEPLFTVMQHADGGDPDGPWSTAIRESCEYLEASSGLPEPQTGDTDLDRTMAEWGEEF